MYMTVKPLLLVPFINVSMTAPTIMMLAVVMEPLLRPILSPIAPSRHMPRMMPAGAIVRCQHDNCRDHDAEKHLLLLLIIVPLCPIMSAHSQQACGHRMMPKRVPKSGHCAVWV